MRRPQPRYVIPSFIFNGWVTKLEKKSFNNILVKKISVVFEFNSTNSSSADTNVDTFTSYQIFN